MGTYDSCVTASVGYGYALHLEEIYHRLPALVRKWKSGSFKSPVSSVPSLVEICIEMLLRHPEVTHGGVLQSPDLRPFEEILRTGDYLLLKERESHGAAGKIAESSRRSKKSELVGREEVDSKSCGGFTPSWEDGESEEYELLHIGHGKLQAALEKGLASVFCCESEPSPVELKIMAGFNDCHLTDGEEAESRLYLLLKDKGVRHKHIGCLSDNFSRPFDPSVTPLEAWTIAKVAHVLQLPTVSSKPQWIFGCLTDSVFG